MKHTISKYLIIGGIIISIITIYQFLQPASTPSVQTNEIDKLNKRAWKIRGTNLDSALIYANLAEVYSEAASYDKGLADAYVRKGVFYKMKGFYKTALEFQYRGLKKRKKINASDKLVAGTLENIGLLHKKLLQFDSALHYLGLSLTIRKTLNNPNETAKSYYNIGLYYLERKNVVDTTRLELLEEALTNLNQAFEIWQGLDNKDRNLANVLEGKANVFYAKGIGLIRGDTVQAQIEFEHALSTHREALEIRQKFDLTWDIASSYNNIGSCLIQLNRHQEAINNFHKGLILYRKINTDHRCMTTLNNIGKAYEGLKAYDKAISFFDSALVISKKIGDSSLDTRRIIYFNQSLVFKSTGQSDKAFESYRKFTVLKDSLTRYRNSQKIAEQEASYRFKHLKEENALSILQRNGVIILSIICIVLFYVYYRYRQRVSALKSIKMLQGYETAFEELRSEQNKQMITSKLEGQDVEMNRLSKDLHDGIGTLLAMAKFHLSSIDFQEEDNTQNSPEAYQASIELLDKAYKELRNISHNLSPRDLDGFGLISELQKMQEILESSRKIKVDLYLSGLEEIPSDNKLKNELYRIFQEIISNILKHADASKVTIQATKRDDGLNILVEDNGKGFDMDEVNNSKEKGLGLNNIRNRVFALNGTCDFDSTKGKGTTVNINLPV